MKNTEIKYIELKTGFNHNGPAWIGVVEFSKSGKTMYFNGKAFKSLNGMGVRGNFYNLETEEEYWISGIKKDQTDRHSSGSGKIMIDRKTVEVYLSKMRLTQLDKSKFELVDILPTDKQKFNDIENEKLS